jgi:lipid-binding SYLF domain-containing protein
MKKILFTLAIVALGVAAFAADDKKKKELDNSVRKLTARFESLQSKTNGVPADKLAKAKGIIIMERTKGGFVFGYERGFGVAMVKDKKGNWSPFSFMTSNEGSFGAQIGGKNTFSVILLMDDSAKDRLINPKVDFGGEAGGTGGSSSAGTGETFGDVPPILVYGESSGVYGGATIKGGSVAADDKANEEYYGQFHSSKDILFEGKVKATEAGTELAKKLGEFAKGKK